MTLRPFDPDRDPPALLALLQAIERPPCGEGPTVLHSSGDAPESDLPHRRLGFGPERPFVEDLLGGVDSAPAPS